MLFAVVGGGGGGGLVLELFAAIAGVVEECILNLPISSTPTSSLFEVVTLPVPPTDVP